MLEIHRQQVDGYGGSQGLRDLAGRCERPGVRQQVVGSPRRRLGCTAEPDGGRRRILGVLPGEDHVIGGHFGSIVEFNPLTQFNIEGLFIRPFHGFGQLHVNSIGGVTRDQSVEHIANDCLRFPTAMVSRVEGNWRR